MQKPDNKPPSHHLVRGSVGMVVYAFLLGTVVALVAGAYEYSFNLLAKFWHDENRLSEHFPSWVLYLSGPFLAVPLLYFLLKKIPEKRQHTPTDLITGTHVHSGRINALAALYTAVASIFSIGFGFSVGYYAPTVMLGAGLGSLMYAFRWIRPVHLYISVGAGAAAAIAAIFHAPIGAVVFVHEVLFRFFSIRAFAPITIAAVSSYVISSQLFDKVVFFNLPPHQTAATSTYLLAAIAGVIAAMVATAMIRAIGKIQQQAKKKQWSLLRQLLQAALITAVLTAWVPQVAGSNLQALHQVISGSHFTLSALLIIFLIKWTSTVFALSSGVPGGIFGPSIFIGAALGGVLGETASQLLPELLIQQQILIVTTMAATLSAVLGAPIAMILITIEITGDFQIISVVMLSVVMANIAAFRLMGTSSFFDLQLKSRGFDIDAGRDRMYAENHGIKSLIKPIVLAVKIDCGLEQAEQKMLEQNSNLSYVVDTDDNLLGQIRLVDLERMRLADELQNATIASILKTEIPHIYQTTSIWQAMQKMKKSKVGYIAVTDGQNNPKLMGVVYNSELMSHYFKQIQKLRSREAAG